MSRNDSWIKRLVLGLLITAGLYFVASIFCAYFGLNIYPNLSLGERIPLFSGQNITFTMLILNNEPAGLPLPIPAFFGEVGINNSALGCYLNTGQGKVPCNNHRIDLSIINSGQGKNMSFMIITPSPPSEWNATIPKNQRFLIDFTAGINYFGFLRFTKSVHLNCLFSPYKSYYNESNQYFVSQPYYNCTE